MKLIDILVQEMPKRGGWPDGKGVASNGPENTVIFHELGKPPFWFAGLTFTGKDTATKEEYESALAASKAEWNGEGLPPVGCECEIAASTPYLNITYPEGAVVKVYAHFTDDRGVELAAFVDAAGKVGGVCTAKCFRPIRSQEEKNREEAVTSIMKQLLIRREVAEAFVKDISEGKIPHIRIE